LVADRLNMSVYSWIKLKQCYVVCNVAYDVAHVSGTVNAGDQCFHLTLFEASLLLVFVFFAAFFWRVGDVTQRSPKRGRIYVTFQKLLGRRVVFSRVVFSFILWFISDINQSINQSIRTHSIKISEKS